MSIAASVMADRLAAWLREQTDVERVEPLTDHELDVFLSDGTNLGVDVRDWAE